MNTKVTPIFTFKSHQLRAVTRDGEPWFVLADACRILGLNANAKNGSFQTHARRMGGDELRTETLTDNAHPMVCRRRMNVISESGLYKLIMRSNKPEAREFQD